ncbi:TetR/AcrR family transcriptional regulator [Tritonibacter scottomollicae]|uniref:TetR/AcrR family transcriptional regulator n=1 Tax=Tritonibacter scottomollicae TaxID=483013 RepID=A0ABZ0HBP8_TRISK|nr:TetR/AcrR family transcriptional regulator [Tritonibacter scottomollicae]WOI32213.1 TetR/AcrR family transcriptional regulator [Tritonibacter scottomollicae]
MSKPTSPRPRGSRDLWLDAALDLLVSSGIDAVKIMPLARAVDQTRTGFYWYFKDLGALHDAMVETWEARNTGQIQARCEAPAKTINTALFNLMDCWLNPTLFDARLDLAIRNWARNDATLAGRLDAADNARIAAVHDMFLRFGYSREQADVRSLTVIYTQVGYLSMEVEEDPVARVNRVPHYVEMFSGQPPTQAEIAAFMARHTSG